MSTMPGAAVIPASYGQSMVLYSSELVSVIVDGAPPVNGTRKFVIPPGKPTRVPWEAGRFITDHILDAGVVRVEETATETGVTYNVEKAKVESEAKLEAEDTKRFHIYVTDCVEDYIKRSKPVPQPSDTIMAIIKRRGYDLKKFGIVPIGWEDPEKNSRVTQLEAQLKSLQALVNKNDDEAKDRRIKELEERLTKAEQHKPLATFPRKDTNAT